MIRSMTGFAAVSREDQGEKVNVTVKSVNHRFLDIAIKAPQALGSAEQRVRAQIQQRLTRGRVDLSLSTETTAPPVRDVVIDHVLLEQLAASLDAARARGIVTGGLTASDLFRIPQLVEVKPRATSNEPGLPAAVAALIDVVVAEALEALILMRETEGRFLASDIETKLSTIGGCVDTLEREAKAGQQQLEAKLRERLADLPPDLRGDPAAVGQEIVRFVARSDVDEEVVRMRGHLDHWRTLTAGAEPCGRKLDFLVQEMNREINTMGSKVEGQHGTEIVIAAKAELERVREQVQNVE